MKTKLIIALITVIFIAGSIFTGVALAATPSWEKYGNAFSVTPSAISSASTVKVGANDNGEFFVAYDGQADGAWTGVYGVMYNNDLSVKKSSFRLNTTTMYTEYLNGVLPRSDNGYDIFYSDNSNGYNYQYRRISDSSGNLGSETFLNLGYSDGNPTPGINPETNETTVATTYSPYYSHGRIQTFDASGNKTGSQVYIPYTSGNAYDFTPYSTVYTTSGDETHIVVAGMYDVRDTTGSSIYKIYTQTFASDGSADGYPHLISNIPSVYQWYPKMSASPATGNIVIVWQSNSSDSDIYARILSPTGEVISGNNPFLVAQHGANSEYNFDVTWTSNGESFIIVWQNGSYAIDYKTYLADGTLLDNTTRLYSAAYPITGALSIGMDDGVQEKALVAWSQYDQNNNHIVVGQGFLFSGNDTSGVVPEPSTIVSILSGLMLLSFRRVFKLGQKR